MYILFDYPHPVISYYLESFLLLVVGLEESPFFYTLVCISCIGVLARIELGYLRAVSTPVRQGSTACLPVRVGLESFSPLLNVVLLALEVFIFFSLRVLCEAIGCSEACNPIRRQ